MPVPGVKLWVTHSELEPPLLEIFGPGILVAYLRRDFLADPVPDC